MSRLRMIPLAALAFALVGVLPESPAGQPPAKKPEPFAGRSGPDRAKLVKQYGGTDESEKAVALGLEWLAGQQKKDGSWAFDKGGFQQETAAATGLTLLAFLGAGETHKGVKGGKGKHTTTVKAGVQWLMKATPINGRTPGRIATQMYSQGIATIALAEAYGMTRDPALRPYAQAAVSHIQKAQGPNGSWGYSAGTSGDTSITGWQVQALRTAKQAGLAVDDRVLKKAGQFLDLLAAAGRLKSQYGYRDSTGAKPGTALTASGLWSRVSIDGWTPEHPGLADGVAGLLKNPPTGKGGIKNLYYLYYATPLVHHCGGEDWATWNEGPKDANGTRAGGLRDWLVSEQIKNGANAGSWDPEAGWFGAQGCGRLGTTAVCVLQLEVYYRYAAAEKGDEKPDAKK